MTQEVLDNFRKKLVTLVEANTTALPSQAFAEHTLSKLREVEAVSDFDPGEYNGAGRRNRNLRLNGVCFEESDRSIHLLVVDFQGGREMPSLLSRAECEAVCRQALNFVEDVQDNFLFEQKRLEPSSQAYNWAMDIKSFLREPVSAIRITFVCDRVLSERGKTIVLPDVMNLNCTLDVFDLARLKKIDDDQEDEAFVIDFTEHVSGGLGCISDFGGSKEYKGYLAIIPGSVLAVLYERFGSRLLQSNVRSYLSTGGSVNKGILNTIRREPARFLAYNNGIAAISTKLEVQQTATGGRRILKATEFQIVNGGQTTATLAHARKKSGFDLSDVYVAAKISEVSGGALAEITPKISEYSNSQNKISKADLASNYPYHIKLEKVIRGLAAPTTPLFPSGSSWFYERARGQYAVELKRRDGVDREAFKRSTPKSQLITKEELAKAELAWRQLPHVVSSGGQKSIVKFQSSIASEYEEDSQLQEINGQYAKCLIGRIILYRNTDALVQSAEWWAKQLKANIVAYAVASLSRMVAIQFPGKQLDFDKIWSMQSIGARDLALHRQISRLAERAQGLILNPSYSAAQANRAMWARDLRCWQTIQLTEDDVEALIVDGIEDFLISELDMRRLAAAASDEPVPRTDEEALKLIENTPVRVFDDLLKWLKKNPAKLSVAPSDSETLKKLADVPRWFTANAVQARRTLGVLERANRAGFDGWKDEVPE
jgi:hypothetical protein